jgi:3-deoxy-D-manno-octulosonic-acid transferase
LEPAVWGKPVLFGPFTDHCAEVASLLLEAGGGDRVDGVDALVRLVSGWLADRHACSAAGQAAQRVVLENQGALARSLTLIESCFDQVQAASGRPVGRAANPVLAGP